MKGTWAYALTLAVLLTGCGAKNDAPASTAPAPAETAAQTALPESVTDTQVTAADGTVMAPENAPAETTPAQTPAVSGGGRDAIIASYRTAIDEKIAESKKIEDAGGNYTIDYTLYDINHNGTPELLIRYGTCEADFRIAVYTYQDGALRMIEDNMGGSHVSFGYDCNTNQLVLLQGHMGGGDFSWYDLDESGKLNEVRNTGGFQFGMDDQPEYTDVMKEYGVAYLPFSTSYSFADEAVTYIYENPEDYERSEQFNELSYSFLENFPF